MSIDGVDGYALDPCLFLPGPVLEMLDGSSWRAERILG